VRRAARPPMPRPLDRPPPGRPPAPIPTAQPAPALLLPPPPQRCTARPAWARTRACRSTPCWTPPTPTPRPRPARR
jgi:hypothetical protein